MRIQEPCTNQEMALSGLLTKGSESELAKFTKRTLVNLIWGRGGGKGRISFH